jgi:hypothetical protein
MRYFPLVALVPLCLTAQDAKQIVSRSVQVTFRDNIEKSGNYSYLERKQDRSLDSSGKVKSVQSKTWSVTFEDGSPYRRLVARDDKPLAPKDQQKEQQKLEACITERRNESWEERQRRIEEWKQNQEKKYQRAQQMLNGFDFKLAGEQTLYGTQAYVIDATPKPGFDGSMLEMAFLPKLKARIWIDKHDLGWIKFDAETLDTVSFGGFLFRLAKGGHIVLEQEHVGNEVWLPKHIKVAGSGRVALIKPIRGDMDISYGSYERMAGGPAEALNRPSRHLPARLRKP